jgi:hypothetical protein
MTRIALAVLLAAAAARADSAKLFVASAVEHPDGTVTLPLYKGTSHGQTVWYVIIDSSDGADAQSKGLNHSQKLANASGTAAAQRVTVSNGLIDFPGTVNFAFGTRTVVPERHPGNSPRQLLALPEWNEHPDVEARVPGERFSARSPACQAAGVAMEVKDGAFGIGRRKVEAVQLFFSDEALLEEGQHIEAGGDAG